jgi:tetratricopeptide (TPR) repeat protein
VADALDFYGWFLERGEGEPGLAHEVARVARTAGGLHARLGELPEAELALDRAQTLLEGLRAADPGDVPAALTLAHTLEGRAAVQRLAHRPEEASASARAALAVLAELDGLGLNDAARGERARREAAISGELGLQLEQEGDQAGALAALERAVELLSGLPREGPQGLRVRYDLARNLDQRGNLRARGASPIGGRPDPEALTLALADHRSAAELLRALAAEEGGLPEPRFRFARALTNQAFVLAGLGESERGMEVAREALRVQEELFADFPRVPIYGADLARTCINLSAFHGQRGELALARAALEQGLAALESVSALAPDDAAMRVDYGTALVNLSGLLQSAGDLAGALAPLDRAREELAVALERAPHDRQARGTAWMIAYRQGAVLLALERPVEAAERARGLLEHDPGLQEIETYAHLATGAVRGAAPDARAALLARAAEDLAALLRAGELSEEDLGANPSLGALRALDGFEAALAAARAAPPPSDPAPAAQEPR